MSTELRPGETVQRQLGCGSMSAEVRWFNDGRAGLDFSPSMDEEESRFRAARRASRSPRTWVFELKAATATELVCTTSRPTGVASSSWKERMKAIGCRLIEGLELLEADVCWVKGHLRAGLMFRNRLHPAVLDDCSIAWGRSPSV